MSFDWYKEVPHNEKLTQGDIFFDFPVPIIEEHDSYPFFKPKWTKKNVILMTQSCDMEQGKTNEVTFCPLVNVEEIIIELISKEIKQGRDNQWKSGSGKEGPITIDFKSVSMEKKARKKIDELRKGEFLVLHLLNESIVSTNNIQMGAQVVLLRDTYQMPLQSVQYLAHDSELFPNRLRLLPPYREHLSQAFANVYSRIGLPQDIKHNEVELRLPNNFEIPYEPPNLEQ